MMRRFVLLALVIMLAPAAAFAAPEVLVVTPPQEDNPWMPAKEKAAVRELFSDSDVIAEYDDGSLLILDTEDSREVVQAKGLVPDYSLTSSDRYAMPLANSDMIEDFLTSCPLVSRFEVPASGAQNFFIVQFQGPIKAEWLESLEAGGTRLLQPLPPYGYLAWGIGVDKEAAGRREVRQVQPMTPAWKLSSGLMGRLLTKAPESGPDSLTLTVLIAEAYKGQAQAARDALLKIEGLREIGFTRSVLETHYIWEVQVSSDDLPVIANHPDVFHLEAVGLASLCGGRENALNIGRFDATGDGVQLGASYERWLADKRVNGAGATVQLIDSGLDRGNATNQPGTVHTDILGRVAGISDFTGDKDGIDKHGHGTLNAGIVAGNPFTRLTDPDGFLVSIGVAPKSKIFASKVANSSSFSMSTALLREVVQEARSFDASVSLNPWARNCRSFNSLTGEFTDPPAYPSECVEIDALTRVANGDNSNPQPMLFVFAAGNFGWFKDMFSAYLVEKSIGQPAMAKNIISVGAFTGNPPEGGKRRDPVMTTSRGMTQDGRIAPTLVAPGIGITGMASQSEEYQNKKNTSFYPENQTLYTRGNGSSHAAAQVAGAAALFTDWWQRFHNYASIPSPALIKAALINSTEDQQGGIYPVEIPDALFGEGQPIYETVDYAPEKNQGWGGLNMDKMIPDPGKETDFIYLDQDTHTFTASGQVWEEMTIYAVDNSIPMYVSLVWTDPPAAANAAKALVNDLDLSLINGAAQTIYGNNFSKGWSTVNSTPDRVNNVEVIKIKNPYGAYKLRIRAQNISGKLKANDSAPSQDFAIAIRGATLASPKGVLAFTAPYYRCDASAGIILADLDLKNTGPLQQVVRNQNTGATINVTLTENPPNSGVFSGTFDLSTTGEAGKLQAVDGDILTAQYSDADDGTGSPATVNTQAQLDCVVPRVVNFVVSDHGAFSLSLSFTLNKAAGGILKYKYVDGGGTTQNVSLPMPEIALHHQFEIGGLQPCTVHEASLELVDLVGNTNTDDNGGQFYDFQTLDDRAEFFDDLDANTNPTNFTSAAIQGTNDWTKAANYSYSPANSMQTLAVPSIKDVYLQTKSVAIRPYSRLTFYHRFKLEPGFDGAVAEISLDNGLHWRDLGNNITEGKYNAMIAIFSGNPLMARLAWTNAWDNTKVEFRRSWIDLHPYAKYKKRALIRFRMATDDSVILPAGSNGASGWYIDNVKVSYDADCQDSLFMRFDRANYGPDEDVSIRLFEPSLPSAASVNVTVKSETEPAGETVILTRTAANVYEGKITVKNGGAAPGDGKISCSEGDAITAVYSSSANGGTWNPDQVQARAFYFMPALLFNPPVSEGVNKVNNDVEKALVFPMELSALGGDITLKSMTLALTMDSTLDPLTHVEPDGFFLFLDSNEDRAYTENDNPSLADELLGTASMDANGILEFDNINRVLTRDENPRLFLLANITAKTPFGTRFQLEIPDIAVNLVAQMGDGTPIIAQTSRPPKGYDIKIVSRAILVDQNAPTIYIEDGETWESAYHTIGDALIQASNRASRSKMPVEVWVARGRYREHLLERFGKGLKKNVEMYGGFGGTEANRTDPRRYIRETTIERPHRDDAAEYDETHDSYNMEMYSGSVLDGFHLFSDYNYNQKNGADTGYHHYRGIWLNGDGQTGVKIRNCIFRNFRYYAVHTSGDPARQCPNSVFTNCVFAYFRVQPLGAIGSGAMFINSTFYQCNAQWDIRGGNYFFYNCAFDNKMHYGSGGFTYSHLLGDVADYNRVRNCVFRYNNNRTDIYGDDRQNKQSNPGFLNPDYMDFRFKSDSPCVDAGRSEDNTKPELAVEFPPYDILGNPRIIGSAPDVGCIEHVPGQPMYYITGMEFGDPEEPRPIIFRPGQPVNVRFQVAAVNQPPDLITLGGRLKITDRFFRSPRDIGMFAPVEYGQLDQIFRLPYQFTLTGNAPLFYNVCFFLDFMKTDGTNEVVDTAFAQFQLPAFVDPVNGDNTKRGGIQEPLKSLNGALVYLGSSIEDNDPKIYVSQGTMLSDENRIYRDNWSWHFWPVRRIEILGGFSNRTWERDPAAYETVWTGENKNIFFRSFNTFAVKLDGFTFKEGVDRSIQIIFDSSEWYFGPSAVTNNIFRNNNGISCIRTRGQAGYYQFNEYYPGFAQYASVMSSMGAPLANAPNPNGSLLINARSSWSLPIQNINELSVSDFTLECWFNPRSLNFFRSTGGFDTNGGVLGYFEMDGSNRMYLYLNREKKLHFFYERTGFPWPRLEVASDVPVQEGKWQHASVTVQKEGGDSPTYSAFLYLDGRLAGHSIRSLPNSTDFKPTGGNIGTIDGNVDEFRIWNRALAAHEVIGYRDQEIRTANGLVMAFHFNEYTDTAIQSSVGNFRGVMPYVHNVTKTPPVFRVSDNLFEDNKAIGIECLEIYLETLVHNNIFRNNQNRFLNTQHRSPFMQVSNNVIVNNQTPDQVALINIGDYNDHNVWILNNTIANNSAKVIRAMRDDGYGDLMPINAAVGNIIWGNAGETNVPVANVENITGHFVYNLIKDSEVGDPVVDPSWAMNISAANPFFDNDGYHLLANSPCIGMGPAITDVQPPLDSVSKPIFYISEYDENRFSFELEGRGRVEDYTGGAYWGGIARSVRLPKVSCSWSLAGVETGTYDVEIYIPDAGTWNGEIPYTLVHKNGTSDFMVNQYENRGKWYNFGTFDLTGGSNQKLSFVVDGTPDWTNIYADELRLVWKTQIPPVGTTPPPSAFIMHNFWEMDRDIDGQERPLDRAWDIGADQYVASGDPEGALVTARLVSGSSRLAGIPFTIDLKLSRNYDQIPAGFSFIVRYPAGAVTALTAQAGDLGAAPVVVGAESPAGDGKSQRTVTALPGNAANTNRNPQLVNLTLTMADPYPQNTNVEILHAASGPTVATAGGQAIPVAINDDFLSNLAILAPNPVANFTAIPTRGLVNPDAFLALAVFYQDASLGYITRWTWDFGDFGTSAEQNPMHEYFDPGSYTVSLTVEGPYGKSTRVRNDYIVASDPRNPPIINFTGEPFNTATQRVEGPAPLRVEFLDATNGPASAYEWTFGDGQKSNAQNPTHIYQNAGTYNVSLKVSGPMNPMGDTVTKNAYVVVSPPEQPQALFNVDNPFGFAPHDVNFTNQSAGTNIMFYYYDFGDGNWSQQENPNHQYILPGTYNARLTIAGASGFSVSDPESIEVQQAFPEKVLRDIILGKVKITEQQKTTLDFNADGMIDAADVVHYLNNQR